MQYFRDSVSLNLKTASRPQSKKSFDKDVESKQNNISQEIIKPPSAISIINDYRLNNAKIQQHYKENEDVKIHIPTNAYSTNGVINSGFLRSESSSNIQQNLQRQRSQPQVIREQYWTWSCSCRHNLTKREKKFMIIILGLAVVIFGLITFVGVLINRGEHKSDAIGLFGGHLSYKQS